MVYGEFLRHERGRGRAIPTPPWLDTVHKKHDILKRSARYLPGLISGLSVHYGHFSSLSGTGCMPCMGRWESLLCGRALMRLPLHQCPGMGWHRNCAWRDWEGTGRGALPMPQPESARAHCLCPGCPCLSFHTEKQFDFITHGGEWPGPSRVLVNNQIQGNTSNLERVNKPNQHSTLTEKSVHLNPQ